MNQVKQSYITFIKDYFQSCIAIIASNTIVDIDTGQLKYEWATTATAIALVATAIVQFGSTLVAAIYLEKAMTTRKEEIDQVEIDQDVRALEEAEENFNKAYTKITQWNRVPVWAKLILVCR